MEDREIGLIGFYIEKGARRDEIRRGGGRYGGN